MKSAEVVTNSTMPLRKRTVLNIMYAQNYVADKLADVFKAHELSGEQYNVLRILRGRKGSPANMCSIQENMIAKTSNTTRLVDKLLLKGFVTREVCPQNRRKMDVSITQKGLEILAEIDPLVDAAEADLAAGLTDEDLETLNQLLEKYRK